MERVVSFWKIDTGKIETDFFESHDLDHFWEEITVTRRPVTIVVKGIQHESCDNQNHDSAEQKEYGHRGPMADFFHKVGFR